MTSSRFLALFFPQFPLQHLVRGRPALLKAFTVVHCTDSGTARVCALSEGAARSGVRIGWSLPQVRARLPVVQCLPRDFPGEERTLEAIAEALGWVSPRIAWAGPGCLVFDVAGTAHLHGGELGLEARLQGALEVQGVRARGVVAERAATARAMAQHGARSWDIVAPGEDAAALGRLPIAALDEGGEIAVALGAVGMHDLASVAALGPSEMARRFGDAGVRIHQQARGVWREALDWRRRSVPLRERMDLPDPCQALDGLVFALQSLLLRLEGRMLGRGVAVVDWSLALDMDVGDPHEESFHLSCPLQSASVLLAMARHRLQCVRLPEPVVAVTVWTSRTQPFAGVQEDLLDGSAAAREPLHALLSRLSAALGAEAVHSQHSADRHRPERAVRRAPFQPTHRPPPVSMPKGARPTRLLHTPEALEIRRESRVVIWRGRRWHFVHLGAPERISGEWWEEPFHRDYHVMWLEEGGRWWIHWDRRVGEWRLHGFFE